MNTTDPQAHSDESNPDYRYSHLQRGGMYDAAIAADPFDAYMARFERAYLLRVIPRLFPGGPPRYLDFACGTGRITETVAPLCSDTVGVDISASMLAEAHAKCPSAHFIEADLTTSELDIGTFDLATAFRFFGNAQQELRIAVLHALHRLLRPKAYLILNTHRNPRSIAALLNAAAGGGDQGMDLHYSRLRRLLRTCGFEVVSSRPVGVWMFRNKFLLAADFESTRAQRLESIFRHPIFTPIAPDAVIVARRLG